MCDLAELCGAGGAPDTLTATLLIVRYPSQNVTQLFALVGAAVPFAPTLTTAPTDFTLATSFQMTSAGGDEGFLLAIDAAQHIWVYTYANLYDAATGADDLIYGEKIAIFDNDGSLLITIPLTQNAIAYPLRLAADPFGNMWTINADSTLTKYASNGAWLSPTGGFKIPISMSPPMGTGEPSPGDAGNYLSIDPFGNLWIAGGGSTSSCYVKLNNSGQVITPAGDFCSKAGRTLIDDATDGSGNAWFYGTASVSKVSGNGAYLNSGVNTNGCFYFDPAAQIPPQTGFNVAAENLTYGIIYDRVQDQLWGIAATELGAIRADGTQVFCDTNGSHLPVIPGYETKDANGVSTLGFLYNLAAATDGAGNLWFLTGGGQVVASGKIQITGTTYRGLNEIASNGNLLTPFDASKAVFGLQPLSGKTEGIGIDGYGNIWTVDADKNTLTKVQGLATPKNYQ